MIRWQVWRAVFVKTCDGVGASNSGRKVHREACGWLGVDGGAHKVRGKRKKKKKSNTHKNTIGLSCCACTVDTWAGGLWGWFEASLTWQNLAECNVEIAQYQGIDIELPLQVGGYHSFHEDGAVTLACPCHSRFCVTFLREWGCRQWGVVTEIRTGQDTTKKTLQLKTNQKSNKQKNKTQVNSNIHFATVQP